MIIKKNVRLTYSEKYHNWKSDIKSGNMTFLSYHDLCYHLQELNNKKILSDTALRRIGKYFKLY